MSDVNTENLYIGTKVIQAWPYSRSMYNSYRGWETPADEDGTDEGYLVEYIGTGRPNHPQHENYISWSPKDVFDDAYNLACDLDFGQALRAMKAGHRVAREGWNGKGMWIVRMSGMSLPAYNTQGTEKKVNDRTARWIGEDTPLETLPYFAMWTADKKWLPGWLASQSDMNAEDWVVLPS